MVKSNISKAAADKFKFTNSHARKFDFDKKLIDFLLYKPWEQLEKNFLISKSKSTQKTLKSAIRENQSIWKFVCLRQDTCLRFFPMNFADLLTHWAFEKRRFRLLSMSVYLLVTTYSLGVQMVFYTGKIFWNEMKKKVLKKKN